MQRSGYARDATELRPLRCQQAAGEVTGEASGVWLTDAAVGNGGGGNGEKKLCGTPLSHANAERRHARMLTLRT